MCKAKDKKIHFNKNYFAHGIIFFGRIIVILRSETLMYKSTPHQLTHVVYSRNTRQAETKSFRRKNAIYGHGYKFHLFAIK